LYLQFSDTLCLYYFEIKKGFQQDDSKYIVEYFFYTTDSMVLILKDSFGSDIPYSNSVFSFTRPFVDSIFTPKMTYLSSEYDKSHNTDSTDCYIDSTTMVKDAFNKMEFFGSRRWRGGVVSNCGPLPIWLFPDQTTIYVGVCEDRFVRDIEVYPLRKGGYSLKTSRPLLILNKINLCSFGYQKILLNKQQRIKVDSKIVSKYRIIDRLNKLNSIEN